MSTTETPPAWFTRTAVGRKLVAENESARLASRQVLVDEINQLQADMEARLQVLLSARETAQAARDEAVQSLADASKVLAAANNAVADLTNSAYARQQKLRAELRDDADPRLDEFRRRLLDERAQTCRVTIRGERIGAQKNLHGELIGGKFLTNEPSLRGRLAAILAAMERVEALRYQATEDLDHELRQIWAELPSATVAVEINPETREPVDKGVFSALFGGRN